MNKLLVLALIGLLAISTFAQQGTEATPESEGEGPQTKEEVKQEVLQQHQQQQQGQESAEQPGNEQQEIIVDNDEDRVAIMEEWEKHMQDFVPDEMLTFEVDSKKEELFMEDIQVPTQMRGAFFVSYFSEEKIDFALIKQFE